MKREARPRDPLIEATLSISQVARRWHTSRKAIRRLLGRQVLNFVQWRGQFRIPRAEITRYELTRDTSAGE